MPEAPQTQYGSTARAEDSTSWYPEITPTSIIVAVNNDLRTSPDTLHKAALKFSFKFESALNVLFQHTNKPTQKVSVSTRFISNVKYVQNELGSLLLNNPNTLGDVRLALSENFPPMSLHLGVVRVGIGGRALLDILYDTTDSNKNHPVFGCIAFDQDAEAIAKFVSAHFKFDLGIFVQGY